MPEEQKLNPRKCRSCKGYWMPVTDGDTKTSGTIQDAGGAEDSFHVNALMVNGRLGVKTAVAPASVRTANGSLIV